MIPAGLPLRTRWRGGVVLAVFALTPLMAYLGPLGFAVLIALAGLLLSAYWARPRDGWAVGLLLGCLAIWAVGASGWSAARITDFSDYASLEQATALKLVLQLALYGAFVGAAAHLSGAAASRALTVLCWGLLGLALVLVVEGFTGAAIYQFLKRTFEDPIRPDLAVRNVGQGSVVLALLAWPALIWLGRRRTWAGFAVAFAVLISAFMLGQASPAAAFLAGGVAAAIVWRGGRTGAWIVGALLALQVLASPWLIGAARQAGVLQEIASYLPASWEARLVIWPFVAERIMDHPVLGWGLDASRTIGPPIPLHPHNAGLQIWLELGAIGAALFAVVWVVAFKAIGEAARRDRTGAAACAGAAGSYFTIGALSYGVWQEWWLALGALTAAVCCVLLAARWRERMAEPPQALRVDELTPL